VHDRSARRSDTGKGYGSCRQGFGCLYGQDNRSKYADFRIRQCEREWGFGIGDSNNQPLRVSLLDSKSLEGSRREVVNRNGYTFRTGADGGCDDHPYQRPVLCDDASVRNRSCRKDVRHVQYSDDQGGQQIVGNDFGRPFWAIEGGYANDHIECPSSIRSRAKMLGIV